MRKVTRYSLAMAVSLQVAVPQVVFANGTTPPSVAVVAAGGAGGASYLTAGAYDINKVEASYTEALARIIENNSKIQAEDREFLKSKGKAIGDSLKELVEKRQAFVQLGQEASTTTKVELTRYLSLVNEINTLIEKVRIDLQEASLISVDTLPSASASVGDVNLSFGPGSTIDMSVALVGFSESLERLALECNNVQFRTLAHKGAFQAITENALTPDLSRFPQMTEEEIDAALIELQAKQTISKRTQDMQQVLADQIVGQLKQYIQSVGTEEFLRARNGNDFTYLSEMYRTLEKSFFMRSYLRKKYGLQIGALQPIKYPAQPLHVEGVFNTKMLLPITGALENIRSQTAKIDEDLMTAYNSARQFVEFYDRSLTPILSSEAQAKREQLRKEHREAQEASPDQGLVSRVGSSLSLAYQQVAASFASRDEIMAKKPVILNDEQKNIMYNSDDTGLIARISGATTFFTGQTSTVEALLAVMRLVLADIREEVMLNQGDWGSLQSYHQQRFMATPEQTIRTVKTICDIDRKLSPAARERAKAITNGTVSCALPPTGILAQQRTAGTISQKVQALMDQYEKHEVKRAQDARSLRMLIDQSLSAQSEDGDQVDDTSVFQ